jgi:hypothetical protein
MSRRLTNGWQLLALCALALILMCGAILLYRPGEAGIHLVLRATARTSLTFFLLAFSASSVWRLWPGAWSRWQLRNRRYLGLSFATSHTLHLLLIVALARSFPQQFRDNIDTTTLIAGGIAYGFIFAMAATSFDRTAAWIGARRWKVLHTVGSYYIWFIFVMTFAGKASSHPRYWWGVVALVAIVLLRIAARRTGWWRPSEAPQPAR